jgi:hypothetical protein
MTTVLKVSMPLSRPLPAASVAFRGRTGGGVLRPGVLITDSSGDILFWNAKAKEALELLGNAGCLDDLFDAQSLERLFGQREWLAVTPRGAAAQWRVRGRRLLDSGRSLVFFFADSPA